MSKKQALNDQGISQTTGIFRQAHFAYSLSSNMPISFQCVLGYDIVRGTPIIVMLEYSNPPSNDNFGDNISCNFQEYQNIALCP